MPFTLRARAASAARMGFNGELHEQPQRWQILGNGYRAFNPVLSRFHSADDWSPFDEGGMNAYAYCGVDPINNADPTGHFLHWVALGAAMGAVGTGVGGLIASNAGNHELAERMGNVALGLGIGAVAAGALATARWALRSRSGSSHSTADLQTQGVRAWKDHAPKLRLREDRVVVQTHTGPFANVVLKRGKLTWVSSSELARRVKSAVPRSEWGKPVQLIGCSPAYGGKASSAQRFADVWEGPVLASRRTVYSDAFGRMTYKPDDWRVFQPQRGPGRWRTAMLSSALAVPGSIRMRLLVARYRRQERRSGRTLR